jgi:hypothetical protein
LLFSTTEGQKVTFVITQAENNMNKIYFSLHLKIKIKAAKERIGTLISEKCFSYIPSRKVSGVLPIVKVPKRT